MTDLEALLSYRLREAVETLDESKRMVLEGFSPRSVVNRAYYAMFYAVLALFIRFGTEQRTSKHSGVISLFDRDFVLTGKLDPRHSKSLHRMFEARQKADYRELVDVSAYEATQAVTMAEEFLAAVRDLIGPVAGQD